MQINMSMSEVIFGAITLIAIAFGSSTIFLFLRLKKSREKVEKTVSKFEALEAKINTLELQTLESRLNPHLFKNVLNSIQSHAYQTYFALDKLANVLDYILYESRNKFVAPKEEIEFALNLIEDQQNKSKSFV